MRSIIIASVIVFMNACTAYRPDEAVVRPGAIPIPGSPAEKSITVKQVVSNSEFDAENLFERSLKESLSNQDIIAGENAARYELSASVENWHKTNPLALAYHLKTSMTTTYTLFERVSGETVWSKQIDSEFSAHQVLASGTIQIEAGSEQDRSLGYPSPGTRLGAKDFARTEVANAGAVRTNIARFIEAFREFLKGQ